MKQTRLSWRMVSRVAVVALTLYASPVMAGNEAEVAEHLIELVKIGRGVLSEQMKNINDPAKADKGFTGDYMSSQVVDPANSEIRYHLAVVLAQTGLKKEARDELDIALKSGIAFEGSADASALRKSLN